MNWFLTFRREFLERYSCRQKLRTPCLICDPRIKSRVRNQWVNRVFTCFSLDSVCLKPVSPHFHPFEAVEYSLKKRSQRIQVFSHWVGDMSLFPPSIYLAVLRVCDLLKRWLNKWKVVGDQPNVWGINACHMSLWLYHLVFHIFQMRKQDLESRFVGDWLWSFFEYLRNDSFSGDDDNDIYS